MKLFKKVIFFIMSIFFLGIGYQLIQRNTLCPNLKSSTLIIGIYGEYPPYSFIKDGKRIGYDTDVLTEIAQRMTKDIIFIEITDKSQLNIFEDNKKMHMKCSYPDGPRLKERIIISPYHTNLKLFVDNTLYELEEDGTCSDIAQRWNLIQK